MQKEYAKRNTLLGYIDHVTAQPIKVPTLSPDYYLLDYTTWIAILAREKHNPFTRMEMTEKDLIILTEDNFEEYRAKIANLEELLPDD